jgi:hypothetical protein
MRLRTLLEGAVVDHLVQVDSVLPGHDIVESRTGLGGLDGLSVLLGLVIDCRIHEDPPLA